MPRSQQKSSHVGAARTNPVKPAVFYWEAAQTEGGHSFTPHLLSNRKVMSDDPFSILQHAEVVFFLWKTTFSQESNTSPSFGHVRKLHHPFICCYQRYSIIQCSFHYFTVFIFLSKVPVRYCIVSSASCQGLQGN